MAGRGATRVGDAQGTPAQRHTSPSTLVDEEKRVTNNRCIQYTTTFQPFPGIHNYRLSRPHLSSRSAAEPSPAEVNSRSGFRIQVGFGGFRELDIGSQESRLMPRRPSRRCLGSLFSLGGGTLTARVGDAQGTPAQSHISPSIQVDEQKRVTNNRCIQYTTTFQPFPGIHNYRLSRTHRTSRAAAQPFTPNQAVV